MEEEKWRQEEERRQRKVEEKCQHEAEDACQHTSPSTHITMWTGIPTWDIAMFAAIASLASCDVMWPGYIGLTGTRFGLVPISAFILNWSSCSE